MELDRLLTASKITRELRLESEHTGQAFLRASLAMQPSPLVEAFWRAAWQRQATPGNHAIAFGLVAQGLGLSETSTVQSYLYSVVAGWVAVAGPCSRSCDRSRDRSGCASARSAAASRWRTSVTRAK